MKKLKIRKKWIVTFTLIIGLFIVTVVVSVFGLETIANNFTEFYQKPFPVTSVASELRINLQAYGKDMAYSMVLDDKKETEKYIKDAQNRISTMEESVEFMRDNFSDTALIDQFDQVMESVKDHRGQVLVLIRNGQSEEAAELYFKAVQPLLAQANDLLVQIDDTAAALAGVEYKESMNQKTNVLLILLALSVITLATTIFLV